MRLKIAVSVVRFRPWAPSAPPQPFATACRTSKPREKPYKLSDSGGLFLLIERKGSKLWRHAFRYDGKQKLVALGAYPWSSDRSRQFLGRPFILLSPVFIFVEAISDIGGYSRVFGFGNRLAILLFNLVTLNMQGKIVRLEWLARSGHGCLLPFVYSRDSMLRGFDFSLIRSGAWAGVTPRNQFARPSQAPPLRGRVHAFRTRRGEAPVLSSRGSFSYRLNSRRVIQGHPANAFGMNKLGTAIRVCPSGAALQAFSRLGTERCHWHISRCCRARLSRK